jgi:hypothetical protein
VPNVTGDLLTSLVVTRSEKLPFVMPGSPAAEAVVEEAALAS